MFTRPTEIEDATIAAALHEGWAFEAMSVAYLARGFGSHHWVAQASDGQQRFITVDDLASRDFLGSSPAAGYDALARAFATAQALHKAGLDWVVGPSLGTDGQVLSWLQPPYSIAVFPYVDGVAAGEYDSDAERMEVIALMAELHRCRDRVAAIPRRETFAVPNRADLELAIDELTTSWSGGPYAEPARALLAQHLDGVRRRLADYDRLVQHALRDANGWTITHGEPHSSNLMRTDAGLRLIDWDTALIAPPERDLWMLVSEPDDAHARTYTGLTGRPVDGSLLRLYALWWDLCEIAIYVTEFRKPHGETEDTAESWRNLQHFIGLVTENGRHNPPSR